MMCHYCCGHVYDSSRCLDCTLVQLSEVIRMVSCTALQDIRLLSSSISTPACRKNYNANYKKVGNQYFDHVPDKIGETTGSAGMPTAFS